MGTAPSATITLSHHRQGVILRELAQGGFSTVYLIRAPDDSLLACKQIKVSRAAPKEAEAEALREITAHSKLGGPKPPSQHIIPLLESNCQLSQGAKIFTLVFPFYSQGSLAGLLNSGRVLSEADALTKFKCLASALACIHQAGVAHCDVKTHNVMLDKAVNVVLIDFGSSTTPLTRTVQSPGDRTEIKERAERFSSAAYRAPELWDPPGSQLDYSRADVFALGCLLWACLVPPLGYTMFESSTQGLLSLAARTASFKFPTPSALSDGIPSLIANCCALAPESRLSASQALDEACKLVDLLDFGFNKE